MTSAGDLRSGAESVKEHLDAVAGYANNLAGCNDRVRGQVRATTTKLGELLGLLQLLQTTFAEANQGVHLAKERALVARAEFDALTYGGNPDKAAGAKMGFAQIDDEASLAAIKVGTPATEVGSAIVKLSGISEMLQTVADQVATGFNEEPFGGAVMQTQDYIDAWKTSI